jgi:predicted nuclease of predicted toxin-antitoxin system
MKDVAADLERQRLLVVEDIKIWEEAEPPDSAVAFVLDSDRLIHAVDEDFARVDPTNGEIFTLAWSRVGELPSEELDKLQNHRLRWRLSSWPDGRWETTPKAALATCLASAKLLIWSKDDKDNTLDLATIELLDPSDSPIYTTEDLVRMYEAGELP